MTPKKPKTPKGLKAHKKPKPAKPPRVDSNSRYGIDISDTAVRIVQVSGAGIIIKAASLDLPEMPDVKDEAFINLLSKTIKEAARSGKLPRGVGMPCVLVTGDPHIIIRRFIWPEMPPDALLSNAKTEIVPYLPSDIDSFNIHYRVVRRNPQTENMGVSLDVMVAAIPGDLAQAYVLSARKAGYKPIRLDIRENARAKLTKGVRVKPEPDEEQLTQASFGVLDIENPQINLTLYLNGVFYSNRYFASFVIPNEEPENSESVDILESIMVDENGAVRFKNPADTNNNAYDTDALANEIASIIDYIQYRERNSNVECLLLLGNEKKIPGIIQSFQDHLDIPVYTTKEWLKPSLLLKKQSNIDISAFLDAYGAILPVGTDADIRLGPDLDLKPPKKINPAKQLALPMFITLAVLAGGLYMGVKLPNTALMLLDVKEMELDKELARYTITQSDILLLQSEIETMNALIDSVEGFYALYPQASAVLHPIYTLELFNQKIESVNASAGTVTVSGITSDFQRLASNIITLRENPLFTNAAAQTADAVTEEDEFGMVNTTAKFNMTIDLQIGAGTR